jgi:nitroreductase
MEVFEAVRTVRAIRRYDPRPVPDQIRHRIIEAGRLAASASNQQPWHFIVIEDREMLNQLGEIMRYGPYTAGASFAIVVVVERGSAFAVSDGSRAIQNMILEAWSDGVGSNWVGFGPMPKVEKLLGVPETFEGLAVLPFGYPATKLGRGEKKRKPVSEVASRERFGTPFA